MLLGRQLKHTRRTTVVGPLDDTGMISRKPGGSHRLAYKFQGRPELAVIAARLKVGGRLQSLRQQTPSAQSLERSDRLGAPGLVAEFIQVDLEPHQVIPHCDKGGSAHRCRLILSGVLADGVRLTRAHDPDTATTPATRRLLPHGRDARYCRRHCGSRRPRVLGFRRLAQGTWW
jgi:hypothetical protein